MKSVWVPTKTRRRAVLDRLPAVEVAAAAVVLAVAALAAKVVLHEQTGACQWPLSPQLLTVLQVLEPLLLLLLLCSLGGIF